MKKILISLLSIIFIISMITNVHAATGSISSGASADAVVKGKTFTVTLAATSDSPIDGMYTKISYDKNVLSLESASAGENYGNSSSEGEILVTNNSSNTSPTSATLYTITFKVLDNANVESTTISFNESELHLNVDGAVNNFSTSIENITINIKADDTETPDGTGDDTENPDGTGDDTENPDGTGDGTENPDGTGDGTENPDGTESEQPKKDTTIKNDNKLAQTGAERVGVIAIIALGIVTIVSYVSYKRYKNI